MGARRQQWMPFWPPFLMAGEQFVENTSSCGIKLIAMLFYQIKQKRAQAPLANPFWWPPTCQIGAIRWTHSAGGGKWLTNLVMFVVEFCCLLMELSVLFLL